jgi:hypothetical protein
MSIRQSLQDKECPLFWEGTAWWFAGADGKSSTCAVLSISAKCHQAHSERNTQALTRGQATKKRVCTLRREISASYLPSRGEGDNAPLRLSTRLWLRLAHVSIRQSIGPLLHLDLRAQGAGDFEYRMSMFGGS